MQRKETKADGNQKGTVSPCCPDAQPRRASLPCPRLPQFHHYRDKRQQLREGFLGVARIALEINCPVSGTIPTVNPTCQNRSRLLRSCLFHHGFCHGATAAQSFVVQLVFPIVTDFPHSPDSRLDAFYRSFRNSPL
jgi:hypothetical protein